MSILHDNGCPHVAQSVVDLFIDYAWETPCHQPYSPDLSPPDYDLFPKLKKSLHRTCFGSLDELATQISNTARQKMQATIQTD